MYIKLPKKLDIKIICSGATNKLPILNDDITNNQIIIYKTSKVNNLSKKLVSFGTIEL